MTAETIQAVRTTLLAVVFIPMASALVLTHLAYSKVGYNDLVGKLLVSGLASLGASLLLGLVNNMLAVNDLLAKLLLECVVGGLRVLGWTLISAAGFVLYYDTHHHPGSSSS